MDKRCERFLFRKLNGLQTPATILTCVIKTQQDLKSGSGRSAAMRCRSIGYSSLVHPVHQSDQSFSGNSSGCLCKHTKTNLRAKLKSPKLSMSSWEDRSPSRSTANNQKCSESSSRSLSYSNPCITSVYASHLLPVAALNLRFHERTCEKTAGCKAKLDAHEPGLGVERHISIFSLVFSFFPFFFFAVCLSLTRACGWSCAGCGLDMTVDFVV